MRFSESQIHRSFYPTIYEGKNLFLFHEKMFTIATQHMHTDHLIPEFTRGHSLSPNHVQVNIYNLFNKRSPLEKEWSSNNVLREKSEIGHRL